MVLSFEKTVSTERLVNACKRALEFTICNFKTILNILCNSLNKISIEKKQDLPDTIILEEKIIITKIGVDTIFDTKT